MTDLASRIDSHVLSSWATIRHGSNEESQRALRHILSTVYHEGETDGMNEGARIATKAACDAIRQPLPAQQRAMQATQ